MRNPAYYIGVIWIAIGCIRVITTLGASFLTKKHFGILIETDFVRYESVDKNAVADLLDLPIWHRGSLFF